MKQGNWQNLALAKLVKEYDKSLMLDLSQDLFTGHYSNIFKILQTTFIEVGRLPSFEALDAAVKTKAPKDILPVIQGILKSIHLTPVDTITNTEIISGLKDQQLIHIVDQSIEELVQTAQRKDIPKLRAVLNEIVSEVAGNRIVPLDFKDAMFAPDHTRILTTGDQNVNEHISGIHGLTLIAAKSGAGKSVMLLQLAIEQYLSGLNVLFVSLELSAKVLGQRMQAYISGVPFSRIIKGTTTKEDDKIIAKAMEEFFNRPNTFKVVTTPMDSMELKNLIATQKALFGTDAIYIDYLNLIDTTIPGQSGAWLGLQTLARELHKMTVNKGVTIISAVQVNIEKASKPGIPPVISTRGSSELFFSASLVLFLESLEDGEDDNSIILWVLKNRLGPTMALLYQKDFAFMKMTYVMEV